jgi:hypothetical protein
MAGQLKIRSGCSQHCEVTALIVEKPNFDSQAEIGNLENPAQNSVSYKIKRNMAKIQPFPPICTEIMQRPLSFPGFIKQLMNKLAY